MWRNESNAPTDVVVVTSDERLAAAASRIAEEAGCGVRILDQAEAFEGDAPAAVIRGVDQGPEVDQTVEATWPGCPIAVAALGSGGAGFLLPDQADDLLQWVEDHTQPPRRNPRCAIVAAGGGLGASTLAVALAHRLGDAASPGASLVDLNPQGTPLAAIAGTDPAAPGWGEILSEHVEAPCAEPGGVCVVTGAAAIAPDTPISQLRRAIEGIEATRPSAVTVFDAGAAFPIPIRRLAGWCDRVIVLAHPHPSGVAALVPIAREIAAAGCPLTIVVRHGRGKANVTGLRAQVPAADILTLRDDRTARHATVHGVPGWVASSVTQVAAALSLPFTSSRIGARWRPAASGPTSPHAGRGFDDPSTGLATSSSADPVWPISSSGRASVPDRRDDAVFAARTADSQATWRRRRDLRPFPLTLDEWEEGW